MRPARIHNLSHNAIERSPKRVVYLDTETTWQDTDDREHHTLRLWVARLDVRETRTRIAEERHWAEGRTGDDLVDRLEGWCRSRATLWVFCHNLTVDLCTTRVVERLLTRGWTLGDHALTNDSPWARLSRGSHRITLADSATWLPTSIERLGIMYGIAKPALPENDDSDAVWFTRCRADVTILATAIGTLLDWWDTERLGCWSLTGTATAWNMYRHHPDPSRPVIDPNPEARAFERRAIYGGRRDVWRTGHLPKSRYVVVDLERAHLTAAAHLALPMRRRRPFDRLDLDDHKVTDDHWGILAEVEISTATPRYPWRWCGRVWHPVGTFRTVLAGPEIAEAHRRGELRRIGPGYSYRLAGIMMRWARWVQSLLDAPPPDTPPSALVFAKMASQRVMGKWAARTTREVEPLPWGDRTWRLERGIHHPSEAKCSILHYGGQARVMVHDQEADDAFPAVLAFIQSAVRVALGRLVDAIRPAWRVSANTDGILTEAPIGPDLAALAAATAPFVPRIKMTYQDVEILSAAHTVLDGRAHLSGVPSSASPTGEKSLAWTTWPRMARQLEIGASDGYVREHREVDLSRIPVPAWRLADNSTMPITCYVDSVGTTRVSPYPTGVADYPRYIVSENQHPALAQLLTDHHREWPMTATP